MDIQSFIAATQQHKIVPVFFHKDAQTVIQTVEAAYNGGVRIFEFVNRGSNGLETFTQVITYFKKYQDLYIGVGTIYNADTAAQFVYAGAQFIVSPGLVPALATYCIEAQVAYIPGIGTITEAITAMHLGCEMVKLFPANVIGVDFAKALKSVMLDMAIMPTGGIEPTKTSLSQWFHAGVNCVGMGSQLFDKNTIALGDFDKLKRDIAIAVTIAAALNS